VIYILWILPISWWHKLWLYITYHLIARSMMSWLHTWWWYITCHLVAQSTLSWLHNISCCNISCRVITCSRLFSFVTNVYLIWLYKSSSFRSQVYSSVRVIFKSTSQSKLFLYLRYTVYSQSRSSKRSTVIQRSLHLGKSLPGDTGLSPLCFISPHGQGDFSSR